MNSAGFSKLCTKANCMFAVLGSPYILRSTQPLKSQIHAKEILYYSHELNRFQQTLQGGQLHVCSARVAILRSPRSPARSTATATPTRARYAVKRALYSTMQPPKSCARPPQPHWLGWFMRSKETCILSKETYIYRKSLAFYPCPKEHTATHSGTNTAIHPATHSATHTATHTATHRASHSMRGRLFSCQNILVF